MSFDFEKLGVGVTGYLEKLKTERRLKADVKTLKEIIIPAVLKLNKTRTNAQLKEDIKSVTATVNLTAKTSKKGLSTSVKDIVKQAQEVANKNNIKLNIGGIDNKKLDDIIAKLKQLSQSSSTLDTSESVNAINREAHAMLEIIDNARKAALEKLEFAEANREVRESAEHTADAIVRERNAMESLDNINYILANVNMNAEQGESVFRRFGNTLNEAFATYTVANLLEDAIYEIIDAGKEGIEVVKELNDVATSLRMATGGSLEDSNALVGSYNDLGQELGSITRDVSESADAWLRQGHSIADTNTLITDSMMLSKIANLKSAESTEYLTSIMQAYRLSAEEVIDIVSKLSAVDLESASDAGGLAKAMSRCASAAKMAGVSMDTLIGYISTVKEVTQDSDEAVGNMFKSVFSRMNQIRAGKFVDLETGESLNDTEKVLNKIGIVTRDLNNQLIDSEQILDSIGKSWNEYDSNTQKALATAVAGTYQYNKFIALMQSYGDAMNYANISANSKGVAEEKFGYYLDSLESKTNSLQASLENLATTTFSDELYASALDTSKVIVDLIADTGVLKGLLVGLGASGALYGFQQITHSLGDITQGFANLNEAMSMTRGGAVGINDMQRLIDLTGGLSQSQTRLLISTNNLTDAQKIAILMNQGLTQAEAQQVIQTWGVATAQNGATVATVTLANSLRGLWMTLMANPLVLVTTLISAGVMAFDAYNRKIEETKQQFADLKSEVSTIESEISSLNTQLQTTVDRMNELQLKDTLTFTEKEEYKNLVKQNNELQRRIDLLELEQKTKNKALNKAFVDTMVSDTQDQFEYTKDDADNVFKGNSALYNMTGGSFSASDEKEFIEKQFQLHKKYSEKLAQLDIEAKTATEKRKAEIDKEAKAIETSIGEIETYLSSKSTEFSSNSSEIHYIPNPTTEDDKAVNAWLDYIADFQDRMAIAMGGTNAKTNTFNRLADSEQFRNATKELRDLGEQGQVTAEMLNNPRYDAFIQKLVELGVIDTADNLEGVALAFNNISSSADKASDSTSQFKEETLSLETLNENINTTYDSISKSYDAVKEFKDALADKGLTDSALDSVADLSDELKALVAAFRSGGISADELFEALSKHYENDLENYSNALIEKHKDDVDFWDNVGLNSAEITNKFLEDYKVDLKNHKTYADKKRAIEQQLLTNIAAGWKKYYDAQSMTYTNEWNKLNNELKAMSDKDGTTMSTEDGSQIAGDPKDKKFQLQLTYRDNLKEAIGNYENAIKALDNITFDGIQSSFEGVQSGLDKNSSKVKETAESFNWIEVAIEKVQRTISKLSDVVGATYKRWSTRNNALAQEIYAVNDEIKLQQKAYEKYMSLANSVGLSDHYKNLVHNGAIQIDSISNESLKEQIKQYQNLYEQALECEDAVEKLRSELVSLAKTKFDNIVSEFDSQLSMIEQQASILDALMEKAENKGYMLSAKYYDALLNAENRTLAELQEKHDALTKSFDEMVASGAIEEYSEAWCEMKLEIDGVKESIVESEDSIIKFNNALRDLDWNVFDKMQESMGRIPSEADFLIDLMDEKDMHDDKGNWTEQGQATLGLHVINYNAYMSRTDAYAKELLELNKEIADDPNNQTLLERRESLLDLQRDMILSAQDELKSINDLYSNGYDKLLDSMDKVINKRKSMLAQMKDAHDYQKSIEQQTKEISNLERQLLAYKGDTSESAMAITQQLQVQLSEAKDNLAETEWQQQIREEEKLLDELYNQTEEWINTRLDDLNGIVQSAIDSTNANADSIKATLEAETDEVGIKLSEEMSKILTSNDGMKAVVATYGDNFGTQITTVNSTLLDIKSVIEGMVNASDITASKDVANNVNSSPSSSNSATTKPVVTLTPTTTAAPTTSSSPTTNNSSSGSGSGKSSWESALVYSKYLGNKKNLNVSTSIVDMLKSHDKSAEFNDRAKLYKAMNGSGVYTGSAKQNIFMLDTMKAKGYKKGSSGIPYDQMNWIHDGEVVLKRVSDGGYLADLTAGSKVLTKDMASNMYDWAKINPNVLMPNLNLPKMPEIQNRQAPNVTVEFGDTHVTLPNVQRPEDLARDFKIIYANNIGKVQDMIQNHTWGSSKNLNAKSNPYSYL